MSSAAWMLATLVEGFSAEIVTLGALIMLVPGLRLTVAMTELASGHVVSGTARLAGAGSLFLSIAFGVALGRVAADVLGRPFGDEILEWSWAPPTWAWAPALVIAAASFVVLFQADRADAPWIVVVGVVGFPGNLPWLRHAVILAVGIEWVVSSG